MEIAIPSGTPPAARSGQGGGAAVVRASGTDREVRLRTAARDLEATFLAEMLRAAGFGKPLETFGGGAGEEQFASLLVAENARALAARGGLGLSEHIYRALLERENATS